MPENQHTKSAHTPGPWSLKKANRPQDGAYDYGIIADRQVIAEVFGRTGVSVYQPVEANALLIAAAPDLLDACKELRDALAAAMRAMTDDVADAWCAELQRIGIADGVGVRAGAAIAKAEGHPPADQASREATRDE